jgi:ParB family transcriptional regulator, chromosome partitioning protein
MGNQKDDFDALEQRLLKPRAAKSREKSAGVLTAPTGLMRESEEIREARRRVDDFQMREGEPRKLPLASIQASQFQTRPLSAERVAELVENLRQNPLVTPIVVRRIADSDQFELIAGHHRIAAYKVLGLNEIDAAIVELDDDEAERSVFYDNLLAPQLTDYEKFLGFSARRQSKSLTHEQLADEAGISRTLVTQLLSYEGFSKDIHALLLTHPDAVRSKLASELVRIAKEDEALVQEAIQLLAAGKLKQTDAVRWIAAKQAPSITSPKIETTSVTIKSGRTRYAEILRRESRVTISFTNEADAIASTEILTTLLKERATAKP